MSFLPKRRGEEAAAALERLRELTSEPPTDDRTRLALLRAFGDVVRLGAKISSSLRRAALPQAAGEIDAVCRMAATELRAVRMPSAVSDAAAQVAVAARDVAESARVAALRACLAQRLTPGDLDGFRELSAANADAARSILSALSPEQVASMLGARAWLDDVPPWYREGSVAESKAEDVEPLKEEARIAELAAQRPPEAVVAEYVARGAHKAWVERAAERSNDFAEELEILVESSLDDHDVVGFVARRWHQVHRDEAVMTIRLPARLAASSAQPREDVVELGQLAPLGVEARLVARLQVMLEIDADPEQLVRVQLGRQVIEAPAADGVWRVTVNAGDGVLPLCVEASDGTRVETAIELELAADETSG